MPEIVEGPAGRRPLRPFRSRRAVALLILLAGLGVALAIDLTALPAAPNPLGYEPEDSKQYLRDMELYGGKANLVASGIRQWFDSLWHGRRLAATVACLTPLAVLLYLIASTPLPRPPRPAGDSPSPAPPEGPGPARGGGPPLSWGP